MQMIIPGRFPGLNDFIYECKTKNGKWNGGNAMKQRDQRTICQYIPKGLTFKRPIFIEYTFYEPNARRDKDNISGYFHKVFQDALVQSGVIKDDGWKYISGMADYFAIDRKFPRIEIFIKEERHEKR